MMNIRGFFMGFRWVNDGSGISSKSSAMLLAWHPSWSITWRWALYWRRSVRGAPSALWRWKTPRNDHGTLGVAVRGIGGLEFRWQPTMRRTK